MPDFAGHAPAGVQGSLDEDSARNTGPDHHDHDVPEGLCRTQAVLRLPRPPHVVTQRHRHAQNRLDSIAEGIVLPAKILREEANAALVVDVAGHEQSCPLRVNVRMVFLELSCELPDPDDDCAGGLLAIHQLTVDRLTVHARTVHRLTDDRLTIDRLTIDRLTVDRRRHPDDVADVAGLIHEGSLHVRAAHVEGEYSATGTERPHDCRITERVRLRGWSGSSPARRAHSRATR